MRRYLLIRFIRGLVTMWVIVTILFILFRLLPGDPILMMVDVSLPPETQKMLIKQYGLDKPLYLQYLVNLKNILQGELGRSFHNKVPVSHIIMERVWNTIILMGTSTVLAFFLGTILGALAGWFRGSKFEKILVFVALFLRSSPDFWTSLIFLSIFSYWLGLFPIGGIISTGIHIESVFEKYISLDFLHHLVLPTICLTLYYLAVPLLIMRSSMMEVMEEGFVEMAKAKGLKERTVIFKYAARNALLPVVTMFALMTGFAIGGQVVIETVFNWPGLGREMVVSVQSLDYPVGQGSFLLLGLMVTGCNFFADIFYGYLDPRIKYG